LPFSGITIIMTHLGLKKLWTTTAVTVLLAATRRSMVVAQLATCPIATAVARNSLFKQSYGNCPLRCYETTQCEEDCLYGASGAVVAGCTDGCVYEWLAGYKVGRTATTSLGEVYYFGFPKTNIFHSEEHTFKAGAVGSFTMLYEGRISSKNELVPVEGRDCEFEFNGNVCACNQIYCNTEPITYAFEIDCSAFEGGSILDLCFVKELAAESSLLEILYFTPLNYCLLWDETPAPTSGPALPNMVAPPTNPPENNSAAATNVPTTMPSAATTKTPPTMTPTAEAAPTTKAPVTSAVVTTNDPTQSAETTNAPTTEAPAATTTTIAPTPAATTLTAEAQAVSTTPAEPRTIEAPVAALPQLPPAPTAAAQLGSAAAASPSTRSVMLRMQWTTTLLVGMILVGGSMN
jgi:hypothetical protein